MVDIENLSTLPLSYQCWTTIENLVFVKKLASSEFTKFVKYQETVDIPLIRAQNVNRNGFSEGNFLYVDIENTERAPRSRLYDGKSYWCLWVSQECQNFSKGKEFFQVQTQQKKY